MILDLIISLSAQENFVTILEGPACHISTACKIRRLSLQGSKIDSKEEQMIFPATVNISHVRSLIAFDDAVQWMPPVSKFPLLRVLAFKTESSNNIHLKDLGSLQHLRYLELGGEVETCSLEQWTGPARLQSFEGNQVTVSQVPRWFSSLSELSSLSMWVNLLRQEDLELLGALPMLRFLQLKVDPRGTITEEQLVVGADHRFRSLAEFEFKHYTRCWLKFARGAMPKLQMLELYFEVRKMEGVGFDIGLENLASLKHVTVTFDCDGARTKEVDDVALEVWCAIDMHPNGPTQDLLREFEELMIKDEDEDGHEESEER
jgi:disease resistance protein RPM1